MTIVIAWAIVIYLLTLPFRLALRHRPRRVIPPAVVVVVQIPAPPQAPLTLAQEAEQYLQGQDGAR